MSSKLLSLLPADEDAIPGGGAVIYLRVSTREQAERGGVAEGFSIPAQREACLRKAQDLGVVVEREFIDAGESARSTRRPQLQAMLAYLAEHSVSHVIVHKIDRLARNRADDVEITMAIRRAKARLVSVTENIDETPTGKLLHGIMSDIAEFYSSNLAAEVMKGLLQKARTGGTIGKADLGYLNVRTIAEGVERRTVEVDPVRGPLMVWAFEAYASGEWTISKLRDELVDRGMTTVPSPKRPSKPISVSQLHRFLRSSYYVGKVTYSGVEYDGEHPKLISDEVWQRVQDILSSRNVKGEKYRTHHHYLKSSLVCKQCKSRLIVSINTNRHGTAYPYFVCVGRHQKRTNCVQRAVRIEAVERRVEDVYDHHSLTADEAVAIQAYLTDEFSRIHKGREQERSRVVRDQARLRDERLKLLQAHYAGAVPLDLMKHEQERLTSLLEVTERKLARLSSRLAEVSCVLDRALSYLTDLRRTYAAATTTHRRQINQALFERIEIGDDDSTSTVLTPTFEALLDPRLRVAAQMYQQQIAQHVDEARQTKGRNLNRSAAISLDQVRSFLTVSRRAGGVKETQLAEGVGFEPTMRLPPHSGFQDRRHRPLGEPSGIHCGGRSPLVRRRIFRGRNVRE
jgi:site-specific DNA recombinase